MSTDIATLGIRIDSTPVKEAGNELDNLADKGGKAEKATDSLNDAFGNLKTTLAALGLGALAKEAIDLADTYSNIQGKLKLVTNGSNELAFVTDKLFESAQRSRVGFEATADLYSSLARSTKSLGTSQSDLLSVTETINKALIVSGASAATAEGALTQLGQGFASGTLRGDELNAVLEGTPRLAQAIADGMGVTVGQLRALGAEGKITGETVFNALKSQKDAIEKEFAQMPTTVAQSFVMLENEILKFVGEANTSTGATAAISAAIGLLANNLDTVASAIGVLAVVLTSRYVVALVATTVSSVTATTATLGLASAAEVAGFATAAMGSKMLGFFGGPIGLAVTALALGIGYFAVKSQEAGAIVDNVNRSYEEMRKRLEAAKEASDLAASGSVNVGATAKAAIPGIDGLNGSVRALVVQYYNLADSAKKARIEMAATALQKAKEGLTAVSALTPQGQNRAAANNRAAIGRGDLLALDFTPVTANLRNMLSNGRTNQEAIQAQKRATEVVAQAQKDLVEAAKSTNSAVVSGTRVNDAAIKKMESQIASLKQVRQSATGAEAKNIDKRITADSRKLGLLKAGNDPDAVNVAVGSGGGRSGGGGKSQAQQAYEQATKASESYIESLKKEDGQLGLNAIDQKLYEASIAASKAPTAALKTEILATANAWAVHAREVERNEAAQKDWKQAADKFFAANDRQMKAAKDYSDQLAFETSLQSMNAQERAIATAKRDMETKGIVAGTIAYMEYGKSIEAAVSAKGALALGAENAKELATHMSAVNDNTKAAAATFGDLFGTAGSGFAQLLTTVTEYADQSAQAESRLADVRARNGEGSVELLRAEAEEREAASRRELDTYGSVIGGVKNMFNQKSKAYKVMEAVEKAYAAVRLALAIKEILFEGLLTTTKVAGAGTRMATDAAETASSVTHSGIRAAADGVAAFAKTLASLPFPLNLAAGAAVLAALASVGVAIAGGGGGGGSKASKSAEKEEVKPTDYASQGSQYSVLEPIKGYSNSSSNSSNATFSNDNSSSRANANASVQITYHIDAKGSDDPDAVVERVQNVMDNYQNDTINKAREAVRNDQMNAANRQQIGGAR